LGASYANQPSYDYTKYHSLNTCYAEDALPKAVLEAIAIMKTDPASFQRNINEILRGPFAKAAKCSSCYDRFCGWVDRIEASKDSLPKFSTFL
jgi:hypothetical protein